MQAAAHMLHGLLCTYKMFFDMSQKHCFHSNMEKTCRKCRNKDHPSYKEKFAIMDREALATLLLAVIIVAFFWGAIFALKDSGLFFFKMPAWFVVSCIGGYLLSVVGVIFLVKKVLVDFPLSDEDEESAEAQNSKLADPTLAEQSNEHN